MRSLKLFKDWSSVLLTTTVAALGWATASDRSQSPGLMRAVICSLGLSVIFGILTLALVPSVAEAIETTAVKNTEIYSTSGKLYVFGGYGAPLRVKLVTVCWPQHSLFLLGVVLYVIAEF
jgi:hypothetical protein